MQAAICGDEAKITTREEEEEKNDHNHQTKALHGIKKERKNKKTNQLGSFPCTRSDSILKSNR